MVFSVVLARNLTLGGLVIFGTKSNLLGQFSIWDVIWSLNVLVTEPAVGDAHTLKSAVLTQHFCRVLICLTHWDMFMRDDPSLELSQQVGELDSHEVICH